MTNIKFKKGDLVKSIEFIKYSRTGVAQDWFGVILEIDESAPRNFPMYAAKHKIKWVGGTIAWHFTEDIELIARAK